MSLTENATLTATAENTESAPVETETTETPTQTAEDGSQPAKETRVVPLTELVSERKKKQEAREESAFLRGQLEALQKAAPVQQVVQPVAAQTLVEPVSDNFETWEQYEKAHARYLVDLAKHEIRQENAQAQARTQQVQVQQGFWGKVEALEAEDSDIRGTVVKVGNMVSSTVADLVVASDVGIDLVKYFDQNPKEAKRISQLAPVMAAKEIGKLEGQLEGKPKPEPAKKVSLAPEPIKTVTPSGPVSQDEDNLPIDEWVKRRNSAQYKGKGR